MANKDSDRDTGNQEDSQVQAATMYPIITGHSQAMLPNRQWVTVVAMLNQQSISIKVFIQAATAIAHRNNMSNGHHITHIIPITDGTLGTTYWEFD